MNMWICLWFKCSRVFFCFLALIVTLLLLLLLFSFHFAFSFLLFFFFPQLPTLLSMPSSPSTALGGSALLFFCFLFYFLFFPQLPTLFPPGKGPFASLARVSILLHFYFPLIDMSLFKDREVAMGKPHCNSSIWTFRACTRFKVNFAYAEFHSWHLSPRRFLSP